MKSEVKSESWAAKCAHIYDEETGKTLAVIPGHRCDEPAPAYAYVMASAPVMLKALQSIISVLDGRQPKDIPGAIMAAQYAIDQATGQPT